MTGQHTTDQHTAGQHATGQRTADQPTPTALAVRGGKIQAVGGQELLTTRGPRTQVIDLAGGAVLPGFQDAHVHAVAGGLQQLGCDLSGVHGALEYRRLIAAYAARHDGPWIEGSGWYGDAFTGGFPTRHFLDELVPDRPAAFLSHDCHGVWVNSRALQLAGIDERTPDPADGRIVRDGARRPSGLLLEGAVDLISAVRPVVDAAGLRQALRQAQSTFHAAGITAWQDAIIGEGLGIPDNYETYRSAAAEGWLRSRVTGALWWPRGGGAEEVSRLLERRAGAEGRFSATAVKIVQDGVCENLTAALSRPYAGHPHESGLSFFEPQVLAATVRDLVAAGFDLHLHAVGDRAVAECLDALEPTVGEKDFRHQIAHIDLIAPADIQRMARLGVIANIQPLWARQDPVLVDTKLPYLDEAHQRQHFLFGALHRAGVQLAMGSDWPVSDPTPLWGIHTAVNRTAPPSDPHAFDERSQHEPLLPGERLSVLTALQGYTRCAARANRLDHLSGTLTPGLDADLVILDRDPLQVPAAELGSLRVRATAIAGQFVHEAWDRSPTNTSTPTSTP
ncbi:amidohydrolase family protein, partial [Kineococcus sp. T13]|nr:amidohydrolase family protein [Kineococcus vitellinus]